MPHTSPLLISTHSPGFQVFASPSAVTSATHIPALKCVRKGASLFSGFAQAGRSPDKCSVKKRSGRGGVQAKENYFPNGRNIEREKNFSSKKIFFPGYPFASCQKHTTREAQLAVPNRTADSLPGVQSNCRLL